MSNLYWNIYKNLEKELIKLADLIHIDDKQLPIYSMKIADLLIRVAIEIESISKELYYREGGNKPDDNNLFFDTDCLKFLNDKWRLDEKVVMVSCPTLYFNKIEYKNLKPLHNAHKRGAPKWKKAYQAIKHNRVQELTKGNLENFIHALAALYILNIYYMDQTFSLGNKKNISAFDASLGSSVFSIKVHPNVEINSSGIYKKNADYEECSYLIKPTDKEYTNYQNKSKGIEDKVFERALKQFEEKLIKDGEEIGKTFNNERFKKYLAENKIPIGVKVLEENKGIIFNALNSLRYEAVLNINQY